MEFIFNSLPRFHKRQHRISEWLAKLEQIFILADVEDDARKIKFCSIFIGQTGEDILHNSQIIRHGKRQSGSSMMEEETWTALKQLERGDNDIVNLGAEAAKLVKKAHPEQEEAVNRQAVEVFVHALYPKLVEVQKLGHRELDNFIAAAQCIERLQKDYPSPNMDNLVSVLQDELCSVRKELKESAAVMADNAVWVAQPVVAPAEPSDPASGRHVAPSPGVCAPPRRRRC